MLRETIRARLRRSRAYWPWWKARAWQFERAYRRRRDRYALELAGRGLRYSEADTIASIRNRLRERGWQPRGKACGEIRTFAVIGEMAWHGALLGELKLLGPVVNCDFVPFGIHRADAADLRGKRRAFNRHLLDTLRREHAKEPFDWVFAYVGGAQVLPETLKRIHEEIGIPTANLCLDDKNAWSTRKIEGLDCGQVDLAGAFDVAWTSSTLARGWYLAEGGRPVFMPEGCDPTQYEPQADRYDIPISFLGACYGPRPFFLRHLRKHGLEVRVFGSGWGKAGEFAASPADVFSRSQINLGMGGIAFSEELTNVKGRDFDVCCTGGGVYLTSFNSDLATAFDVGKEILCYRGRDEAIELAKEYLKKPDQCRAMAARARARCLREHRWLHRYQRLCRILGLLEGPVDE